MQLLANIALIWGKRKPKMYVKLHDNAGPRKTEWRQLGD